MQEVVTAPEENGRRWSKHSAAVDIAQVTTDVDGGGNFYVVDVDGTVANLDASLSTVVRVGERVELGAKVHILAPALRNRTKTGTVVAQLPKIWANDGRRPGLHGRTTTKRREYVHRRVTGL